MGTLYDSFETPTPSRKDMRTLGMGKTTTEQRKDFAETITQTPKGRLAMAFEEDPSQFRPDGTQKGKGFFGEIKLPGGGVASEYSVGVQLESRGGKETDIPSLVPTLTPEEKVLMVNDIIPNNKTVPDSIMQKAVDHANMRVRAGKDVFAQEGEGTFQGGGGGRFRGRGATGSLDEGRGKGEEFIDAVARGLARTGSAFQQAMAGTISQMPAGPFGPRIEPKQVEKERKELRKSAKFLWDVSRDPELAARNKDLTSKALNLIGETLPYITATTASFMVAGPVGAFGAGSMVEGNSAYREALDSGVRENKAKMIGVGVGIVSGAVEAFGGKYAVQLLTRAASKVKSKVAKAGAIFAIGTAVEALEEGAQEIAAITGEKTYRDVDWKEATTRTLGSMAGGAFLGGAMRGVSVVGRGILREQAKPLVTPPTEAVPAPQPPVEAVTPAEPTIPEGQEIVAPAEAKQPWEMMREEWTEFKKQYGPTETAFTIKEKQSLAKKYPQPKGIPLDTVAFKGSPLHRRFSVLQALSEGKPVPREVLEEYKSEPWAKEALEKAPQAKPKKGTVAEKKARLAEAAKGPITKAEREKLQATGMTVKEIAETPADELRARLILSGETLEALAQRDILGGEDPITLINQSLKEAVEIRPLLEDERKAELRKRVGLAAGKLESLVEKGKVTAGQAFASAKGILTGKLSGLHFAPIRDKMEASTPGAVDNAIRSIATNNDLRFFEKVNTEAAFNKMIDGEPITLREVDMIRRQFGDEMGDIAKARTPKSSLSDRAFAFWRAGLLTGMKTSMLNIDSTLIHSLMETEKDAISAPVDIIASWFTGKRTVGFTVRGIPKGVKQGGKEGWDYLRTGIDKRHIGEKYDWNPINFGDSIHGKALQTYVETMFHLMGAEDQPFFYGAMSRSLRSQAIAQARNQKLKGKEFKDAVDTTWNNPTEEMLDKGVHDAEMAVFQNRTVLGDIARAMQKAPVIRWAVPFSRTPSAVAMQIINYTPVGAVKEVMSQISKKEFNQRNFAHAVGRSVVGTPVLAIGAALFAKGLMNLDYPDSERERKLWELEGRKPNSIKIGGKWRSAFVLGPAGNVLIIGGYFQQALENSGSPSEAIITAMSGGAKSFTDQTFVTGMSRAVDAIKDPERSFESFFSNMAGSFVPTLLADFANAQDTMNRRTKGAGERIVSRIPFARRTLEPRIDVFGQDLPRYGGNPLEVMIDASRPAKIRQDVVVDEIRRLWDNNIRISPTQLGNRDGYKSLTAEENTILWRQAGEYTYKRLFDLIRKPLYKGWSDEHKAKKFEENITKAKNLARAETARYKLAQGVELRDIRDLVTEDVAKLIGKSGEYSKLLREINQGKL